MEAILRSELAECIGRPATLILRPGANIIGRDPGSVATASANVHLVRLGTLASAPTMMSRQHVRIDIPQDGGQPLITDLGAANGTSICYGGHPTNLPKNQSVPLNAGAVVVWPRCIDSAAAARSFYRYALDSSGAHAPAAAEPASTPHAATPHAATPFAATPHAATPATHDVAMAEAPTVPLATQALSQPSGSSQPGASQPGASQPGTSQPRGGDGDVPGGEPG